MALLDYPSQRGGLQFPAEPMLLDTCLLQHLKFVMETIDYEYLTDEAAKQLLERCPGSLGQELVALGDLTSVLQRNGQPWLVSEISLIEFGRVNGMKGESLRRWWHEWANYCQGCVEDGWYPSVDVTRLVVQRSPVVAEGQQALPIEPALWPLAPECVPPFGPFLNSGDRALIRVAFRAGIPTILTTDLKSFWRYRRALYPLGIEVWRPSDLWLTLENELAAEAARWRSMLPKTAAAVA